MLMLDDDVLNVHGEELDVVGVFLALNLLTDLMSSLLTWLHRSDDRSTTLRLGLSS